MDGWRPGCSVGAVQELQGNTRGHHGGLARWRGVGLGGVGELLQYLRRIERNVELARALC